LDPIIPKGSCVNSKYISPFLPSVFFGGSSPVKTPNEV
jgi:hypothetical protein